MPMYCNIKKSIEEVRSRWQMSYRLIWKCVPRTDSGIYREEEKENEIFDFFEEELIFEEGLPAGVKVEDHIFLFDEPQTHKYVREEYQGYSPGSGDVSELYIYELMKKE